MGQPRPDPVPPPVQCCCRGGEPGTGAPSDHGCGASPRRGRDVRLASLSLSAPPSPCPPPRGAGNAAAATHRAGGTRLRGVLSSSSCRRPPHAAAMFRGHRACPAAAPGARGLSPRRPPSARRGGGGTARGGATRGHPEIPASPHGRNARTARHPRCIPSWPPAPQSPAIPAPRRHPRTPARHPRAVRIPALCSDLRREGLAGAAAPGERERLARGERSPWQVFL